MVPSPGLRDVLRTTTVGVLLGLVVLAWPLEASQPVHVHDASTVGLYNEEHVLASLESLRGDAPLPVASSAAVVIVRAFYVLAGGLCLTAPVVSPTDSRAPPLF